MIFIYPTVQITWLMKSDKMTCNAAFKLKKTFFTNVDLNFGATLFSGYILSTGKFPGQGSNLYHSSDLDHRSASARSLTCCVTRVLPGATF